MAHAQRTGRALFCLLGALASAPVAVADWLVFRGGGVQETRGAWQVDGRQVRFHAPGGALQAVRTEEVDLAASAFLSWQVGDRRAIGAERPPAGAEMRPATDGGAPLGEAPCTKAKVTAVVNAETLEVRGSSGSEVVHLACLDAPEPDHRSAELSALGVDSFEAVERLAPPGADVCVADEVPALVDRDGHRILYVRLADGRDLGEELVARGLALARGGTCARRGRYLEVERVALAAQRGHWGPVVHDLALAIVAHPVAVGGAAAGGAPLPRPRRRA